VDQLHLVELMLTNQTPNVAPMRAGFGAETRCVGAVANRELRLVESLVTMEVGQRHLGSGHQVEVEVLHVKQIVGEFRQLTGTQE
jgi:hypothetical protein